MKKIVTNFLFGISHLNSYVKPINRMLKIVSYNILILTSLFKIKNIFKPTRNDYNGFLQTLVKKSLITLRTNYEFKKYYLLFFISFLIIAINSCNKSNPVDGSEKRFLAEPGPILFISNKSGTKQLYSMSDEGSNVHKLTDDPNFPIIDAKWSPDGSKIALVSPVGGVSRYGGAVYIVNRDGSNKHLLTKSSVIVDDSLLGNITYQGAINPVWSPDNNKIAYSRVMVPEVYANRDIFIINIDGTNEYRITKTVNYSETINDWFDNGIHVLASVYDSILTSKLIKIDLINHTENLISALHNSSDAKVSYNNQFIFFSAWTENSKRFEIYKCDQNGNDKVLIHSTMNTFNYVACVSSDGNSILINSANIYLDSDSFLKNIKTESLVNITPKQFTEALNTVTSWKEGD